MSREKQRFNDDNYGAEIAQDLVSSGKKHGFDVETDDFLYEITTRNGVSTELNATAFPKIDDSISIEIVWVAGIAGSYGVKITAEAPFGDFESEDVDNLFRQLAEGLNAGIRSKYSQKDIVRQLSRVFDKVSFKGDHIEARMINHKELGQGLQSEWIDDNLRKYKEDFWIAPEEKGWYYFWPKDHVLLK